MEFVENNTLGLEDQGYESGNLEEVLNRVNSEIKLNRINDEMKIRNEELILEIQDLKEKVESLKEENETNWKNKVYLTSRVDKQKEEIADWKEKYEKESNKLKDKCKEMENNQRNQIEERGRYNTLLFREVKEQVIGVTEVVTKEVINFVKNVEPMISDLRNEVMKLSDTRDTLNRRNFDAEVKLSKTRKYIRHCHREHDEEVNKLYSELDDWSNDFNDLQKEYYNLENDYHKETKFLKEKCKFLENKLSKGGQKLEKNSRIMEKCQFLEINSKILIQSLKEERKKTENLSRTKSEVMDKYEALEVKHKLEMKKVNENLNQKLKALDEERRYYDVEKTNDLKKRLKYIDEEVVKETRMEIENLKEKLEVVKDKEYPFNVCLKSPTNVPEVINDLEILNDNSLCLQGSEEQGGATALQGGDWEYLPISNDDNYDELY